MMWILLCLQASLLVACHGFSIKTTNTNVVGNADMIFKVPDLKELAPQVFSRQLNFRLAVGDKENPFQMKDMVIELGSSKRVTKQSSTGIHEANLLSSPYFINDKGEQIVALKEGGWEITWKNDSPHGHLTCSFVSTKEVQRTKGGSTLQAGRFFMNHRVWTRETLESERERRREIQSQAAKYIDDRDQKIRKITDEEGSLGSKVVSYAQAAKSMNDYWVSGYKEALYIPLYDEQVLELAPDLILSTRGEVFKVDGKPERIGDCRVDNLKNRQ